MYLSAKEKGNGNTLQWDLIFTNRKFITLANTQVRKGYL